LDARGFVVIFAFYFSPFQMAGEVAASLIQIEAFRERGFEQVQISSKSGRFSRQSFDRWRKLKARNDVPCRL
jgi:hypothetical protein